MIDYQLSKMPKMTHHFDGIEVEEISTFLHPDNFVAIKRITIDIELDNDAIDMDSLFSYINKLVTKHKSKSEAAINKIINN